jgi:hypothetical protein
MPKKLGPGWETRARADGGSSVVYRQLWAQYPGTHWYPLQ